MNEEQLNKEGYTDPTAYAAIRSDALKQKAYYCFKTMISCARLAGFFVNDNLVIEDKDGNKYNSKSILKQHNKHDV